MQAAVEHHGNGAFCRLHNEGRNTQGTDFPDDPRVRPHVLPLDPQRRFFRRQKAYHPNAGQGLREDCGNRRAPHAHIKAENQNGVQHDVGYRADQYGKHGGAGLALTADKHIQAQRQLHEDRAAQINAQVLIGVDDGVVAGAEHIQQRCFIDLKYDRQRYGKDEEQDRAVGQDSLRLLIVPPAHLDGRERRPARSGEGAEGGDQRNDRKRDTKARQGQVTDYRDMADIDPVNDIIQNINQLGDDRGDGQLDHQPRDRRLPQQPLPFVLCFHWANSSCFSLTRDKSPGLPLWFSVP